MLAACLVTPIMSMENCGYHKLSHVVMISVIMLCELVNRGCVSTDNFSPYMHIYKQSGPTMIKTKSVCLVIAKPSEMRKRELP